MDPNQTPLPSSEPSPLSRLSGPDGKPLQNLPDSPPSRQMPTRREKYNLVFMMFTLMDREERKGLIKALKAIRPRLDLMYPMGMKEGDIKNDLAKAVDAVVPEGEGHAEPEKPGNPLRNQVFQFNRKVTETAFKLKRQAKREAADSE
jgi:hypothetical protein